MHPSLSELIKNSVDPLLELSPEAMGLSLTVHESSSTHSVHLQGGFPTSPLTATLLPVIAANVSTHYPNTTVSTDFLIKAHQTQLFGKSIRGVKNTIAVASGKGGVGKSTVAVNLAAALARAGAKVGILDADIYGPSIPLMLGPHAPVHVQGNHYLPIQCHGMSAMSIGYLTDQKQALIWRGPMLAKSLLQMLDITLWQDLDYLIIDLPPGTGDIQLSLVQKIPLAGAIIVTTPQHVATLDAEKAIKMFEKTGVTVLGMVENMATHLCQHCGHQDSLFGAGGAKRLSDEFNTPILGQLPLDPRIGIHCDKGSPIASQSDNPIADIFMKIALKFAIQLAKKPLNYAAAFPPIHIESQ